MKRFEYAVEGKEFAVVDSFDKKLEWFNSLGAEGWEIFNTESEYNTAHTNIFIVAMLRREIP